MGVDVVVSNRYTSCCHMFEGFFIRLTRGKINTVIFFSGQEALRRFHQYGTRNIYGIKCKLSRRDIVPFPVIHKLETITNHQHINNISNYVKNNYIHIDNLITTRKNHMRTIESMNSIMKPEERNVSTYNSFGRREIRLANTLNEIKNVKRIGGGYPYGPKNFTIVEFPNPIKYEKSRNFEEKILFKSLNPKIENNEQTIPAKKYL
ncbi:hypothetical protein DICVIV_06309 [Dictyocaulus viviparus]|uniref:Uncharacterized protein n=1 Tax=Dictyocaulus viviparus TaxID=29172 RepID=A0A0D8XUU1_DICVI|nr:hypothetical protein DICVIV_06309 [Dictyocaulus viviparus]